MIRYVYNYFEHQNPARKQEIDFCLQKNQENKAITLVLLITPGKPNYSDFFNKINELTGPDDVNILSNSDIFLDESIALVERHIKPKQMFALSRYDWHSPTQQVFFDRPDSQDTWIVRGKIENVWGDFPLGIRGSDNRLAHEFQKGGYAVSNPSKSLRSYHVHNSQVRTYWAEPPMPPPYLTIHTSHL
jgi:hypothetical protein